MKTPKVATIFGMFLLLLAMPHRLLSQGSFLLIVPPEAAGGNEGSSSFAPFATPMSGRFQQVYNAAVFSAALPPGGGIIGNISFRMDPSSNFTIDQVENFQVHLSTTTRSPDSLSPIFADNIGPDERIVRAPASYSLVGGPGTGFSVGFHFDTPFPYNPANGNLLLDFRFSSGADRFPSSGIFDAFNISGDSVASVSAFGLSLPTSGSASSLGLATAFGITAVPEPSSWALLIVGVVCFGLWRKKNSHEKRDDVPHGRLRLANRFVKRCVPDA